MKCVAVVEFELMILMENRHLIVENIRQRCRLKNGAVENLAFNLTFKCLFDIEIMILFDKNKKTWLIISNSSKYTHSIYTHTQGITMTQNRIKIIHNHGAESAFLRFQYDKMTNLTSLPISSIASTQSARLH